MRVGVVLTVYLAAAASISAAAQTALLGARYTNATFGYRLEYPRGWRTSFVPAEGGIRIVAPGTEVWLAARASAAVPEVTLDNLAAAYEAAVAIETPADFSAVVDAARRALTAPPVPVSPSTEVKPDPTVKADPTVKPDPFREPTTLAGAPAVRITFTAKSHVAVLAVRDGILYALQFSAPASTFAPFEPYFTEVVRSFQFQGRLKGTPGP